MDVLRARSAGVSLPKLKRPTTTPRRPEGADEGRRTSFEDWAALGEEVSFGGAGADASGRGAGEGGADGRGAGEGGADGR